MNIKTERNRKPRAVSPKRSYGYSGYNSANQYMKCDRCGGSMVFERFLAAVEVFHAWRCVNCGEIMDQVVQKNRRLVMSQKGQAAG